MSQYGFLPCPFSIVAFSIQRSGTFNHKRDLSRGPLRDCGIFANLRLKLYRADKKLLTRICRTRSGRWPRWPPAVCIRTVDIDWSADTCGLVTWSSVTCHTARRSADRLRYFQDRSSVHRSSLQISIVICSDRASNGDHQFRDVWTTISLDKRQQARRYTWYYELPLQLVCLSSPTLSTKTKLDWGLKI